MKNLSKEKSICFIKILMTYVVFFAIEYVLEKNHIFHMCCSDDFGALSTKDWNLSQIFIEKSYKYRPISSFIIHIILKGFPLNTYYLGYCLLAINTLIATVLYWLLRREKCDRVIAFGVSLSYLVCRFSYYQVTQLYGIMEGVCTLFAILLIYSLYKYNTERRDKWFYWSLAFYILVSLSHERYAVMIVPLLWIWGVCFLGSDKKRAEIKKIGIGILSTIIMAFLLKNRTNNIMVGTGGADVKSTFSLQVFVEQIKKSIFYLLGINGEDEYLSLVSWAHTPNYVQLTIIITIIMVIIIFVVAIKDVLREEKRTRILFFTNVIMFILSIGVMIGISSCTIRVEMRWMYVPYLVLLILLVYLCCFAKRKGNHFHIKKEMFLLYTFGIIIFNIFARQYYGNLYYWSDYVMGNNLAIATYKGYGDELEGKNLIIITNYTIQTGAGTFTYKDLVDSIYDDVDLILLSDISELQGVENLDDSVILQWDYSIFNFVDITNSIK